MERHIGTCLLCNQPSGGLAEKHLRKLNFQIDATRHDALLAVCNACFDTAPVERIEEAVGKYVDGIQEWAAAKPAVMEAIRTERRQAGRELRRKRSKPS